MAGMDLLAQVMRSELTRNGFSELRTPDEVDAALTAPGTVLVAVNSNCGCAGGTMRPAVVEALRRGPAPDRAVTVFASGDAEATARAREYFTGHAPSSPSIALLRDGELVFMLERSDIKPSTPQDVAERIVDALREFAGDRERTQG
ncbi:MAG TPA: BrxA/BrxB family bacilliredoxin [Longimicrobiales bacterium]